MTHNEMLQVASKAGAFLAFSAAAAITLQFAAADLKGTAPSSTPPVAAPAK